MLIRSKGHDQKQPSRGVLWRRCSENMRQIYRRTLCQSATSIKLQGNFIEITLRHRCSPVTVLHICIFTKHLFLKTLLGSCFCIMHHIYFNDNICYIYIYIYINIYVYIYIYIYIHIFIAYMINLSFFLSYRKYVNQITLDCTISYVLTISDHCHKNVKIV